ncbi:hypothetical protein BH09PSE3_BH09PSE3_09810 [soil metagenome]
MGRKALKLRDNRRALRLDVRLAAGLREPGSSQRFDVDVIDLSMVGFRCETSFTLTPGSAVFVTIPGLGPLECTVAWRRGYVYGCEFDHPLHNAVFDHIIAQYRRL